MKAPEMKAKPLHFDKDSEPNMKIARVKPHHAVQIAALHRPFWSNMGHFFRIC